MNALRTCVYIYIWQFSSFRAPPFFSRENGQDTRSRTKMATDGYQTCKAILRELKEPTHSQYVLLLAVKNDL